MTGIGLTQGDSMAENHWLVEIRAKDWVPVPAGVSSVVTYEEVEAPDEYYARHRAFEQFERRIKYEPIARRKFEERGRPITDYCAPDAVRID